MILFDTSKETLGKIEFFASILEWLEFRIHYISRVSSDELAKGRLLIIGGKRYDRYSSDEIEIIVKHVQAGHRLLVLTDSDSVPFFDSTNKILGEAGIYPIPTKIRENERLEFATKNINKNHKVTIGVNELVFRNAGRFILAQKKAYPIDVLVRSEKIQQPPNAIISCVARMGNGRIMAISTWEILTLDLLSESDNALFLISSIYWLLDKSPPQDLLQRIERLLVRY